MINIDKLRRFFELLANKYQVGGYVAPSKFNLLAQQATKELQMDLYGNIKGYRDARPIPKIAYSQTQAIVDYLAPFLVTKVIEPTKGNLYATINLPSDYLHYESGKVLYYQNGNCDNTVKGSMDYAPLIIIDGDKMGTKLTRKICPPTSEYPMAQFIGGVMRVYPASIDLVELEYFRLAKDPIWAYTIVGGKPIYDPSSSQDVEFSAELMNLITAKMLGYLGVNLRESELYQMAKAEDLNI